MCKQPNLFWCGKCELYVSKHGARLDPDADVSGCPSCGRELEPRHVPPPRPEFWCPGCQSQVPSAEAIPAAGACGPLCPLCSHDLERAVDLVGNPASLEFGLTMIGVIARLLTRSGVIERLDEYAADTKTPLDNFALHLARGVIQEAAKL